MEKVQITWEPRVISKFLKLKKAYKIKVVARICQNEYNKLAKKGIKGRADVKKLADSYHKSRS